jgi:hypothetical protein
MPLKSRSEQIIYILPYCGNQVAAEAGKRRFFETMTAWVLMLALVLVATVAALWLATWLDEAQTTFRTQHDLFVNRGSEVSMGRAKRPNRREVQSPRWRASD